MIVASTIVPDFPSNRFSSSSPRMSGEGRRRQLMPLQQVPKPQDRRLVRHHVVTQLHAAEPAHRLAVIEGIFRLGSDRLNHC